MSQSTSESKSKKVTFQEVSVREYPIVLSSNPASKYGPAVEIGWEYSTSAMVKDRWGENHMCEGSLSVDQYEKLRPSAIRREPKELYLYLGARVHLVKKHHYSDSEIQSAEEEKKAILRSRKASNRLRNPAVVIKEDFVTVRRNQMIRRAVRNLHKEKRQQDNIYAGWWLPLSAHIF